jgi:membrane associated rhomboid family serine protease
MLIHLPLVAAEPWRLLSACFVHYGLIHVGMNMLALVHLSRLAEPAVGSVRLLIAYVVSGVLGFATTLAYGALSGAALAGSTAGASGAIFGLMGLVLGFLLRRRDPRWKAWLGQAVMFSLLFGFAMPGVNNSAHVGGLAVGLLFGLGFAKGAPRPSARWQRVLAALLVVAVLGSLVLALRSPLPELLRAQFGDG